jgi:hypothetical protein
VCGNSSRVSGPPKAGTWRSRALRLAGLSANIIALVALAVMALAGNQNAGFGRTVTRGEQMFLLLLAALLSAIQTIAYLIEIRRTRQGGRGRSDGRTAAAPGAKN